MALALPSIDDVLNGRTAGGGAPPVSLDDILNGRTLPPPGTVAPNTGGSLIGSALQSGVYSGLGAATSGLAAGAKAIGLDSAASNLSGKAAGLQQSAQDAGRSDIEGRGYFDGGVGGFLQKGAYDVTKALPAIAGTILGGAAVTAAAPELAVGGIGGLAARALGTAVPELLGGAATGASAEAATAAGARLLPGVLGGAAVTVPQAIGGNYAKAEEQPGGATQGDAIRAIAQGVPVGLAQTVAPSGLGAGIAARMSNSVGSLGSRILSSGLANAAAGAIGSGLQAASESSFDPTLSAGERAQQIVSAAATGGAMGGLLGGLHGFLPSHVTLDNIGDDPSATTAPGSEGNNPLPTAPAAPPAAEPTEPGTGFTGAGGDVVPAQGGIGDVPYTAGRTVGPGSELDTTPPGSLFTGSDLRNRRIDSGLKRLDAPTEYGEATEVPRQIDGDGNQIAGPEDQAALSAPAPGLPAPDAPPVVDEGQPAAAAPADAPIQDFLKDNNLARSLKSKSPIGQVVDSATDLPDLYNKIDTLPDDHPAGNSTVIGRLQEALGLTDAKGQPRDLDTELKVATANGDDAAVPQIQKLISLRDQALAQRPPAEDQTSQQIDDTPTGSIPTRSIPKRSNPMDTDAFNVKWDGVDRDPKTATAERAPEQEIRQAPADNLPATRSTDAVPEKPSGPWQKEVVTPADAEALSKNSDVVDQAIMNLRGDNEQTGDIGVKPFTRYRLMKEVERIGGDDPAEIDAHQKTIFDHYEARDNAAQQQSAVPPPVDTGPGAGTPDDGGNAAPGETPGAQPDGQGQGTIAEAPGQTVQEPEAPRSLADRVTDAARSIAGDNGGDVPIADIRKALPDIAPKDLDTALQQVHADDSDNQLTQAPAGQRKGVDGVSTPAGKMHMLHMEAVEGRPIDQTPLGDLPSTPDEAPPAIKREADVSGPYPGEKEALKVLRLTDPGFTGPNEARTAMGHRLQEMWSKAQDNDFDDVYRSHWRDVEALSHSGNHDNAVTPDGFSIPKSETPFEAMQRQKAERNGADSKTGTVMKSKAMEASRIVSEARENRAEARDANKVADKTKTTQLKTRTPAQAKTGELLGSKVHSGEADRATARLADQLKGLARGPDADDAAQQAKTAKIATKGAGFKLPTEGIGSGAEDVRYAGSSPVEPTPPLNTPKPTPPDNAWSTYTGDTSFLQQHEIKPYLNSLLKQVDPAIGKRVSMIDTYRDFPVIVKQALKDQGFHDMSRIGAVAADGKVILRADKLYTRDDLQSILAHETLGHIATQLRFGDFAKDTFDLSQHQRVLSMLFDKMGGMNNIEKIARQWKVWDHLDDGDGLAGGAAGLKAYARTAGWDIQSTAFKARIVDEMIAHAAASTKVVAKDNAIRAISSSLNKVLVKTLNAAGLKEWAMKVKKFTASDLSAFIEQSRNMIMIKPGQTPHQLDLGAAAKADPRLNGIVEGSRPNLTYPSIDRINDDHGGLIQKVGHLRYDIVNNAKARWAPSEWKQRALETYLAVANKSDIWRMFGKLFPEMGDGPTGERRLDDQQLALRNFSAHTMQKPLDEYRAFVRNNEKAGALTNDLMRYARLADLSVGKSWAEHTWLHQLPDVAERKQAFDAMQVAVNKLNQMAKPGEMSGIQHYQAIRDAQRFSLLAPRAQDLHELSKTLEGYKSPYDPGKDFAGLRPETMQAADAMHDDTGAALDWANREVATRATALQEWIAKNAADPAVSKSGDYRTAVEMLEATRGDALRSRQGDYFPLDRTGDYGVGFNLKMEGGEPGTDPETGLPRKRGLDQAALAELQAGLDRHGFTNVALDNVSGQSKGFARFETYDQANAFNDLMKGELAQHLDMSEGPGFAGPVGSLEHAGYLDTQAGVRERLAAVSESLDKNIAAAPPEMRAHLEDLKQQTMANIRTAFHDQIRDNSIRARNAFAEKIQGSPADMLPGLERAAQTRSEAWARTNVAQDRADNIAKMRQRVKDIPAGNFKQATLAHTVLNGWQERDAAAQVHHKSAFFGALSSLVHTAQIALSPGYMVQNVGQVFTAGIPQLSKVYGYGQSTKAILKSMPVALRVATALIREGRLVKGGINLDVLKRAGMSDDMANHFMMLTNRAKMEFGGYSHAQSATSDRAGVKSITQKAMEYANATATLSEIISRSMMAHASKTLYDSAPGKANASGHANAVDFAANAIDESMYKWASSDTSKLFSGGGPFGAAATTMFKFHAYPSKVFGKIATEAYRAISKGDQTAAEQAESRRYMYAHLTAAALVSGSLGLPAAGWVADAMTKLSGLFNEGQDFDVRAHYRHFLAGMFGKEVGEVLAHGLPSAMGADLTDLGDNGLLPLGKLLEDRRKFEDAWPSYLSQFAGPAGTMAQNTVVGARDIMNGRILEGLSRSLPVGLRNSVRAYSLAEHGYMDSTGRKMDISPTAFDILRQVLGVENSDLAEAREKSEALEGLQNDRAFRAGSIKQNIARAMDSGDKAGIASGFQAASRYDRDPANIGQPMSGTVMSYISARKQAEAMSRATKTPLGTLPTDLPAMNLTRY